MAIGAAVVAGITAVGLVVGLSGSPEVPDASRAPATAAVVLLANAADTPAGTGDWAYTSSVSVYSGRTLRMQVWDKTDGTGGLVRADRDGTVEEFRTAEVHDDSTQSEAVLATGLVAEAGQLP